MSDVITTLINNLPAILTAFGVVVTAIGTIVLGVLNYRRTGRSIVQSKTNEHKIDNVITQSKTNEYKIDNVHTIVDGTSQANAKELSRVTEALGKAQENIDQHLVKCKEKEGE